VTFKLTAVACIVAATALTAVAAASPAASRQQRIVITDKAGSTDGFVLAPLSRGPLTRVTGTAFACCWSRRFGVRNGESVETDAPVIRTFSTRQGTFTWRASIDWYDAGNGYVIGTGTWRIVHGTGFYEHLEGSGRVALAPTPDGNGTARAEGLVDLGR
jgi:hypothetical protein